MAGLSLIPRPHLRLGMGQGKAVHSSPKLNFGRAKNEFLLSKAHIHVHVVIMFADSETQ